MTQMKLSKEKIRYLKQLSHALKPYIMIGEKGLSDTLLKECEETLAHHELIKIKISTADRDNRDLLIQTLCEKLDATVIQKIGHIATIFKRNHAEPKILFSQDAK